MRFLQGEKWGILSQVRKEISQRGGVKLGKNQHVVPVNGQWGIRGEGNEKLTSIHGTQADAIAKARDIAINQQSELIIHGRNGHIRERNSYGNDPFPPRG